MTFDAASDIFEQDEMKLFRPKEFKHLSEEEILDKKGIFYLKDLVTPLSIDMWVFNRTLEELNMEPKSLYEQVGLAKLWGGWIVRMPVFAPFFRSARLSRKIVVSKIPADWDANSLMRAKGVFSLTQVCRLLPFSARQLRYRCRMNPEARAEYGIWKEEDSNRFLVDMEAFSSWIEKLWHGHE